MRAAAAVLAASDTVVRTVVRGIGVILPGEDFEAGLNRKAAVGGRIIASASDAGSILPGKKQGLLVFVEALA